MHLYDGRLKANQEAHYAVLDIDVGNKDLQQCADAVIRLRAEYLYACGHEEAISFRFTSGDPAAWRDWAAGMRPVVQKNLVSWHRTARPDSGYASFRRYLNTVFTYAGSASLAKQLDPVANPEKVQAGNVFIHGGFPGHAVLVVDVATGTEGERLFLLAQSYMPAQEIHVLRNPGSRHDPWYPARSSGQLATPEWTFRYEELRQFAESAASRQSQR